ncbi:L-ribulose-5-phosphate 3-epimerase [Breznakiella homolactica]|uniref:L-ribulose-5-phosphate 3-epimerase n=2 Tax=Breznakiella homolactica TaxID=2798577 RepID=A0A7T8BCA6_9SPIR|nr:L-ribulose-5-phosphate 3-epimerase [Breznakiella homolactica]
MPRIGIYEKALPPVETWKERLETARAAGYDFVELSVDESDSRMARLGWSPGERKSFRDTVRESGIDIPSLCLSCHRKYPLGSADPAIRKKARSIMESAIRFAVDTGIRTIQLAAYDVYYEPSTAETKKYFLQGLEEAVSIASGAQIMLAAEIMDHPLVNSITRWKTYAEQIRSPWFQVYPDVGNLSAWWNDVPRELELGLDRITSIHLKDTLAVGPGFPGKFKEVPFGEGCVDFVEIFRTLSALRYQGSFLIEMWTEKSPDPIMEIEHAREWILGKMAEAGICVDPRPLRPEVIP